MENKVSFSFGNLLKVVLMVGVGVAIGVIATLKIQSFQGPKQTVSITGSGQIEAITDQANITAQVKNTASTQELSQTANKKDVATLIEKLSKLGIPESRITQSSFIQPNFMMNSPQAVGSDTFPGGAMMKIRPTPIIDNTPTTTTNITVVLDPIGDIKKVLSAFSENPNTQITSTYYSVKNMKSWETKAKEMALKDARTQVESIAKINGLNVGKLVTISDQNNPGPIEPMMLNNAVPGRGAAPSTFDKSTQSESANNTYYSEQSVPVSATYYVTYELNSKIW